MHSKGADINFSLLLLIDAREGENLTQRKTGKGEGSGGRTGQIRAESSSVLHSYSRRLQHHNSTQVSVTVLILFLLPFLLTITPDVSPAPLPPLDQPEAAQGLKF